MTTPRRILGIDPGLAITGYGVLEFSPARPILREAGIIRTADDDAIDMAEKVLSVYKGVVEVIAQFQPEAMAVEQLYAHYDHPRTAILMGHARGVILLAAAEGGLEIKQYSPATVKKTVVGVGSAAKAQVGAMVARLLRLKAAPRPADAADGVAVALTCIIRS